MPINQNIVIKKIEERAVIVGVATANQSDELLKEYLDELEFLAHTAGAVIIKRFSQKLEFYNPRTFVGKGKLEEIKNFIIENEINLAIFDDELSPSQMRNIEEEFKCKILDRTNLILDIFAKRAQTATARTQVELAQYQYLLPRLTGMWTHLERQQGGIGTRGPGEKEIETDKRIIKDKIAKLKEDLIKIDKQNQTQRKSRGKMIRVALVGYTNVGKSTIMNLISKSEVFAENKLFATLDTTVRKVVIDNLAFLLADTVGFIRKLPHQLVESFKSTLDEVREADILLHVIDISHSNYEEQIQVVDKTLSEIMPDSKPTYYIFNKVDAFEFLQKAEDDLTPIKRENYSLEDLKKLWIAKTNSPSIFISAKQKSNIEEFKSLLYNKVKEVHITKYPYDDFLFPKND